MNIYGYDREARFNKIDIPNGVAEHLRGFIKDFVEKNGWTEQNQFYFSQIALPFAGQPRRLFVNIPSIFELPTNTDEDEKLRSFEIGYFVSPTEWVPILDGEELIQDKPVFREAFLHAILSPQNEQKQNTQWPLIDLTDRDAFVSALGEQVEREIILQNSLGETEMDLLYLELQKACHDYGIDHSFEQFNTRVRGCQRALIGVEGLVARKEARG